MTDKKYFRILCTQVEEDALVIAAQNEGYTLVTTVSGGQRFYHVVREDSTPVERVLRGLGTIEDRIAALPLMTAKELSDTGLYWAYREGKIADGAERAMREMHTHAVDTRHVRRGTRYVFDIVRESLGVDNLHEGTEQQIAGYRALLNVTIASGQIEWRHDPHAVHMTPELAAFVLEHVDKDDDIIRYIKERQVIARDVELDNLTEYLFEVHRSVSTGYL